MKRKWLAWLCMCMVLVATIIGAEMPDMTAKAAGSTLIIHYGGRKSYDGWNIWVWEDGKDGKQVDFTAEDSYGKIATCNISKKGKVGFIVRLNDWEKKDVEEDRFVEVGNGVTEIWLTSGKKEMKTKAPAGAKSYDLNAEKKARQNVYYQRDALKLNVHFYDFKKDYKDVASYAWLEGQDAGGYDVRRVDQFGALFQIGLRNEKNKKTAGLQFTMADGSRECQEDRIVDLTKAVNNRLDVYIVQGNSKVFYKAEDAVLNPVISNASFVSGKEITFSIADTMNTKKEKLVDSFTLKDQDGKKYPLVKVWSKNPGVEQSASLILKEPVDFSNTYTLYMKNHEKAEVSVSDAFSTEEFEEAFTYTGDDLGASYTKKATTFRVWAPTASKVKVNFYKKGSGRNLLTSEKMEKDVKGTWVYTASGDKKNLYYTYSVTVDGNTQEAVDPYAHATGINGKRGMVIDLDATDPEGFAQDTKPEYKAMTDASIYELHIRDFSVDEESGMKHKGKYLALTETGTKNQAGDSTGLDYLKKLGITHLHLLPVYDFASVDETKEDEYNWGYDPLNYNVPEGSYATDASDGNVRVKEYKQMVKSLHENNIRVVMDVVYNHTYNIEDSNFQKIVPDYYFRKENGSYTNGSGCGNETATERAMMRKFIVDSVVYWAKEYHVDGFRFDLMGVVDIETMNQVRQALDEIDPTILVYGEGWTGGESGYDESKRLVKSNMNKVEGIAAFSDDFRDGLKGDVFKAEDTGFISGKDAYKEDVKLGIVGATAHRQIDQEALNKSSEAWANAPSQCINYVSCHDNLTLWDKLQVSVGDRSEEERKAMNKLAAAMTYTSQGIPFMQAGEEFLRTKPSASDADAFDDNSYHSPDSTNSLKWGQVSSEADMVAYYKGLIAFRKAHNALRMTSASDIQNNLAFRKTEGNSIVYTISGSPNGEVADSIMVIHNGNEKALQLDLPKGKWNVYINAEKAGTKVLETCQDSVTVDGISTMVLVRESTTSKAVNALNKLDSKIYIGAAIVIIILILLLIFSNTTGAKARREERWRRKHVKYYR